ncbi:PrpF domain-containing protein [Sporosarcina sp. G11-34]|uniref:PrpF domain-containing protein n=1 Tax=Sporosarcina sp. G11-34 TaxID=2849605 RepID=UPI0022A9A7DD|nr:PrpF domain-containing protein [Sporosarcina sp. G11-34]MCZ2260523.1 PrpF protein [Sporosarcina sp. G11-34]
MSQFSVPCAVYRGGTSRGLFFSETDLPKDKKGRQKIFLNGLDAYNLSQVNGLGSGTSHTSKVVVIKPPSVEGAHVDYTFYQIGIGEEVIDANGTCGNLMAAVGAYAIDEGLVSIRSQGKESFVPCEGYFTVTAFNTNIGKLIRLKVPTINGKSKVNGTYEMSGMKLPGAKYVVDILAPGGGKLGSTLPLGTTCELIIKEKQFNVSVIDIVNPFVYLTAESIGVDEKKLFTDLSDDNKLLDLLELVRCEMSVQTGLTKSITEAVDAPAIPKIAIVSAPEDYVTTSGTEIMKDEVDIIAKMVSMGKFHRTFAGSGLYNLAAAALIPGTIPNNCSGFKADIGERVVRIGHPDGIAQVRVRLTADGEDIEYVGLDRTARRIIAGNLYIPE